MQQAIFVVPDTGSGWSGLSEEEQAVFIDCLLYIHYQITFEELCILHPQYMKEDQPYDQARSR